MLNDFLKNHREMYDFNAYMETSRKMHRVIDEHFDELQKKVKEDNKCRQKGIENE